LPARNITLTVVNIKDPSIKAKIRTNNNGYFTNKSLPSGYYTIFSSTQKRSFKAKIELKKRKEALGTFVLKSKSQTNFKSQLHLPGSYIISNKKNHKAKVEIKNYGDTRGTVCFKASMRDPNLRSLNFKASCKTLKPNGSVIMPLSISFNPINTDKLSKVLDIQLTDDKGVQHVQPHPFTVYKEHFTLKLDTALKTLNTYIVLPNQEIKKITPSKKGVVLPKQSNANYQLIIANTDPRYPTKYEADIGAAQTLRVGYKKTISKKEAKDIQIFRLQQTISRYPNQGDIGIYNFKVAQTITLNEDAKTHRIPFYQRNHLGDQIHYKVTMSNQKLATVSYKNGFITIKPKPNAHGIASLILKNKDGSTYGNNIKHFTLEVRSINDKPKFTSRPITSIIEGDNYRYFVKGEDIESTHLTKSAITLPAWLKFSQKKGLLYGKAQAKHVGTHKVRLALKDEKDTIYQTFTIKVHAKKRSALPTFATFSTNEDTPLQARIARKVPDEAVEIYMINKKPSNGRVLVKTDGTFIYKPDKDFNGNDTFSVTHNVNGKIKVLLISIDITSVNDIPTAKDIIINPVGIQKLTLDWAKLSQAADIDEDDLFVKIKSKTALGEIVLVNDTILYTPYPNKQGSEKVLLEVSDKQGGVVLIWLYLYNIERSITPKVLKTGQSIIYHAHDDGVYKKSISKEYEKDLKGKVIKDMITLTTWYPEKKPQARTYEEAKEFCEDLEVENVSNWHLPKIEELVLLTDKGHIAPAIDPIFDAMRNDYYWSKSLYKERDNNRWVLNFDQGEDYYRHEAKTAFTLCAHKG
ncbi:MAG: Ig-like domain-containing protein, partial [Thiovulaceae bacterium]|nr:Ig-like domain-containing protein [Sulfurimonadaceae bacterium]